MALQTIIIREQFNAPVSEVFGVLSDHERFGKICGVKMTRIQAGDDGANGLGSVRRLNIGPLPSFQETITQFIPGELIEYKITQGSPIKNHVGLMKFSEHDGKTILDYTIKLESKIPFTTGLIKSALENGISKGLNKYSKSFQA